VESTINPVALVIEPATIPGPNDDGTLKLMLNISSPSTILSLITGTLTVVVLTLIRNPAVITKDPKSSPAVNQCDILARYQSLPVAVIPIRLMDILIILSAFPPDIATLTKTSPDDSDRSTKTC